MGQIFGNDWISELVIAGATTINMPATYQGKPVRITVGGQQYSPASQVSINLATTGFNALDAGSLVANTLYYIYAVQQAGVLGLVASTSAPTTGPTGYTSWKEIGRFRTAAAAATIAEAVNRLLGSTVNPSLTGTYFINATGAAIINLPTSALNIRIRRIFNEMIIDIVLSASGAATGLIRFSLPTGYTIDTGYQTGYRFGSIQATKNAVGYHDGSAVYFNTTSFQFRDDDGALEYGASIPFTWANLDSASIQLRVPIAEWVGLFD